MAGKALFERRRQYAGWKWNRSGIAGTDTLAVRLLRRSGYLPDSQREKGKLEAGSRGKAGKKRFSSFLPFYPSFRHGPTGGLSHERRLLCLKGNLAL